MPRITSSPDDKNKPSIDRTEVEAFFDQRAKRLNELGPLVTVIYQDRHPEVASQKDEADKRRILPILALDGSQRVLDVGCGTGRWASEISAHGKSYHGIDFSKELIEYAKGRYKHLHNCSFTQASVVDLSLEKLGETEPFDLILCAGVLMYLNDADVETTLRNFSSVLTNSSRIVLREPMGIGRRLTLKEYFSEEMSQSYSAIYRTIEEFEQLINKSLFAKGFHVRGKGYMYEEETLNNRPDTRQMWLVIERDID